MEPFFSLPGDELRVKAHGYAEGIHCILTVALMADSEALSPKGDGWLLRIPQDEDIAGAAQGIAELLVTDPEINKEQTTTNNPALFCDLYVEAFHLGHRFCMFALYHGLLNLLADLPEKRHHDLFLRFAWEHIMQHSVYEDNAEHDVMMDEGVEALQAIYKQYQALN